MTGRGLMPLLAALVVLVLSPGGASGQGGSGAPSVEATIRPGNDAVAGVASAPKGARVRLAAGVHRIAAPLVLTRGQVLSGGLGPGGERVSILSGSRSVTGWTGTGPGGGARGSPRRASSTAGAGGRTRDVTTRTTSSGTASGCTTGRMPPSAPGSSITTGPPASSTSGTTPTGGGAEARPRAFAQRLRPEPARLR